MTKEKNFWKQGKGGSYRNGKRLMNLELTTENFWVKMSNSGDRIKTDSRQLSGTQIWRNHAKQSNETQRENRRNLKNTSYWNSKSREIRQWGNNNNHIMTENLWGLIKKSWGRLLEFKAKKLQTAIFAYYLHSSVKWLFYLFLLVPWEFHARFFDHTYTLPTPFRPAPFPTHPNLYSPFLIHQATLCP